MPSVLHFSTFDGIGGAGIATRRLHEGLRRIGVESCMAVASSSRGDPNVFVASHGNLGIAQRIWRRLDRKRIKLERRRYSRTQSPTLEFFSDDRVPGPDVFDCGLPFADIYNLHWVAGLLDYRRFFARLAPATPVVWTLHDMNPFTGGCHYSLGCGAFTSGCGSCVQLGSHDENDLSRRIVERKERALARLLPDTTRIVAPSTWLGREARRSQLLGRFHVEIIPNGIDCETFQPRSKAVAREVFGLPETEPVVLFGADSVTRHRKGFDLLQDALEDLPPGQRVTLAAIGSLPDNVRLPEGVVSLGKIEGGRMLSFIYSAADLLVLPTRADNLPNVALEAMACGLPVVAFDVGGMPDIVRPGKTGLLAPPEDVRALRGAILELVENHDLRAQMAMECRRVALTEWSFDQQAPRYAELYDRLIEVARRMCHNAPAA